MYLTGSLSRAVLGVPDGGHSSWKDGSQPNQLPLPGCTPPGQAAQLVEG
jgi:hypothetical protein